VRSEFFPLRLLIFHQQYFQLLAYLGHSMHRLMKHTGLFGFYGNCMLLIQKYCLYLWLFATNCPTRSPKAPPTPHPNYRSNIKFTSPFYLRHLSSRCIFGLPVYFDWSSYRILDNRLPN
jgi:hypothetical protein